MHMSHEGPGLTAPSRGWRERALWTALALHVLLPLAGNLFDLLWQLAVSVPLVGAFGAGLLTGAASIVWNGLQLLVHALTSLLLLGMARGFGARRWTGAAMALWGAVLSAAIAITTATVFATSAHQALDVGAEAAWAAGLAASWEHVVLTVAWGAVGIALVRGERAGEADADGLSAWSSPHDRHRRNQAILTTGAAVIEMGVGVTAALLVMPTWRDGVPDSPLRAAAAIGSVTHAALAPAQLLLGIGAIVLGRALSMRAEAAGQPRRAAATGVATTVAAAGLQLLVYGWMALRGQPEAAVLWAGLSALTLTRQVVLTLPWWRVLADVAPAVRVEAPPPPGRAEDRARLEQVGLAVALAALELVVFVALLIAGRADPATTIGLLSVLAGMHLSTVPLEWALLGASVASGHMASARLDVRGGRAAAWGAGTTLAAGAFATGPWVLFGADAYRIDAGAGWAWALAAGWTLAKHGLLAAPWARVSRGDQRAISST